MGKLRQEILLCVEKERASEGVREDCMQEPRTSSQWVSKVPSG